MFLWAITLTSTAILYWIYDGYGRALFLMNGLRKVIRGPFAASFAEQADETLPSITILLTVHNEDSVIRQRIENMLLCEYPPERLSVVVASDGSTDNTNSIIRSFGDRGVRLHESSGLGKTATQNAAIDTIESDVIVFTDADVTFEPRFLRVIARHFKNPRVGAVDGRLLYSSEPTLDVQTCQGYYWNYELRLRDLESQLGILAVVAGACFALRRSLFLTMNPAIGEDCIVPLDVAAQGFKVLHEPTAIAWTRLDDDDAMTMRRRIRMTLRNWQGTWTRHELLNPFRSPGYALALWSHKLLRWLSPVFLAAATASSTLLLATQPSFVTLAAFLPFGSLFALAAFGWLSLHYRIRIPGAGTAYSFVLANTAFLIGVWRAIIGHQIHAYRRN
ncbi:MAG: glycosyltransferase [Planctomycetota bacterium]|nr:MAG: glycosyltransferase [Planctomycetota bacterium]